MSWLVTGGAGYIGAHVVKVMAADGMDVVVLDDLSTGAAARVIGATLITGTVRDRSLVRSVMCEHAVDGVMHIAAKKQVGQQSVAVLPRERRRPGLGTRGMPVPRSRQLRILPAAPPRMACLMRISSTRQLRAPRCRLTASKVIGEWLVRDCATWGLSATCLRYFNVAGAAAPELGDPGTGNLIPLTFQALTRGRRPAVFGTDYPTPDGTCIRDYVHVADIADAHLAAARALEAGAPSATYNVGRGSGSSVLEVLRIIGEVTGTDVTHDVLPRARGTRLE